MIHRIADDLGIDPAYKYHVGDPIPEAFGTWLDRALVQIEAEFLARLTAERIMDEYAPER